MVLIFEDENIPGNHQCVLEWISSSNAVPSKQRALVRISSVNLPRGVVMQVSNTLIGIVDNKNIECVFTPVWVLRHLEVDPGDEVSCEQMEDKVRVIGDTLESWPQGVKLKFIEHLNYRHWDEYSPIDSGFALPGEWDAQWPSGMSSDALVSMLPSLLAGVPLSNKGVVAVNALQTTLMFGVEITFSSGPEDDPSLLIFGAGSLRSKLKEGGVKAEQSQSRKGLFTITVPQTASRVTIPSVEDEEDKRETLTSASGRLVGRLRTLIDFSLALAPGYDHKCGQIWGGPRSVAVLGAEGSGKSTVGRALCAQLSQSLPEGYALVRLSARELLSSLSSSSSSSIAAEIADLFNPSDASPASPVVLLSAFVSLCGPAAVEVSANNSNRGDYHFANKRGAVLVIDDVHLLQLAPLVADNREDEVHCSASLWAELKALSASSVVKAARVAHSLGCLLRALVMSGEVDRELVTSERKGGDPAVVVVVGLSSLPPHQQPSSHQGCPVFETFFSLPRGGEGDRAIILENILRREGCVCVQSGGEDEVDQEVGSITARSVSICRRAASLLAGYCPADITAVAQSAKALAMAEAATGLGLGTGGGRVRVSWGHLLRASSQVEPRVLSLAQTLRDGDSIADAGGVNGGGALLEGQGDVDSLSWDHFAGYSEARTQVITRLLRNMRGKCGISSPPPAGSLQEWAYGGQTTTPGPRSDDTGGGGSGKMAGAAPGAVLYGPSGCGKTHLGRIVCSEARKQGYTHLLASSTDLLSPFYGGSEELVRKLFTSARAAAPCVLFIDDFELLAMRRGAAGDGGPGGSTESEVAGRVLSTFLNELDGVSEGAGRGPEEEHEEEGEERRIVVVLVAVPTLACLDEALIRPGRLHLHICLDYPSLSDAASIMSTRLRRTPLCPGALPAPSGENQDQEEGWIREVCRELMERKCGTGAERGRMATVSDVLQLCEKGVRLAIHEQVALLEEENKCGAGNHDSPAALERTLLTREHLMLSLPPLAQAKKVKEEKPPPAPFIFNNPAL